jgi:Helix-turn-helix.
MLYGLLLKTLRKKLGYTQDEVAKGIHVSRVKYSRYETNLIPMDDETLSYLAKFYNTTVEDFKEWAEIVDTPMYRLKLNDRKNRK